MFLQLWPGIHSVNKAAMAGKKIKLEEAISEILVADTD
jgi:hypothetical protein